MKYRIKEIRKANKLWHFISHLEQCTKKEFDKYCKKKEVKQ
jgi:hypothetical protein